ncbi:MAG TPA: hypothetical protein VE640_02445 [Candidatus Bathyarchaeia archaeon]|nr:hypothetical protein [Candidatus Bathyarchaeia archaeon]
MTPGFLGRLTRNAEGPLLLETILVSSVTSFLGIRWFLALTGYPQIGSGGIHVAHMLWGGLLMLLAVMLLLAYLDRPVRHVAAMIAGLGFGTFIDEIGKFVTSDNNYFYRPAIALIYGVFIVAFLVGRTLTGEQRRLSANEALANALTMLAGNLDSPIEADDRARIARLLERADRSSAATRFAVGYLAELPVAATHDRLVERINRRLADAYERLMANTWADDAVTVGVVAYAAAALLGVALVAASTPIEGAGETSTMATAAQILSTIAGAACIGVGVIRLRGSRHSAYHWFMRGLLVWILITQVFVFYSSQLAGLGGLVVDLIAYGSLRFALVRETLARPRPQPSTSGRG